MYNCRSTSYKDELAVAGMFLYKATKTQSYLNEAKANRGGGGTPWALSWDDTNVAADVSFSLSQTNPGIDDML